MRVVTLVPRRADASHRDRLWAWLKPRLPFRVFEGHHDDGLFNRAAALNSASHQAGEWDVAVVNDADCLVPTRQVRAAVELAADTGRLVMAFDTYNYLSKHGTAWLLEGLIEDPASVVAWSDKIGNSPCAVPRALWDEVGGFDERFVGWGYEDVAFVAQCGEPLRIEGPLYHLWHEPGERESGPHFLANQRLYVEVAGL